MLREDNTYVNRADYIYNSHRDYYKKVLDFPIEASKGNVPSHTVIHKFGRNSAITNTFDPITESTFYRTPTSNTALEVVSDDADDNATGAGARSITYEGLQESGGNLVVVTNTVSLNGTTPVALPDSLIRLKVVYVAGYSSIPSGITLGIKKLVASNYEDRQDVVEGSVSMMPNSSKAHFKRYAKL